MALLAILFLPAEFELSGIAHAQDASVHSVGTFGGFMRPAGPDIPSSNGFLTFSADSRVRAHRLRWQNLMPGGKEFAFAEVRFPGAVQVEKFRFVDWTTLAPTAMINAKWTTAYLSRTFPAVHYESRNWRFTLATALDGRAPMRHVAVVLDGKIQILDTAALTAFSLTRMSEPWILLWAGEASGWPFDVPILITFEKRPLGVVFDKEGADFAFGGMMGAINVMPLKGLRRFTTAETQGWAAGGLPADILHSSRALVPVLAAFPIKMSESYTIDEVAKVVKISNHYEYREILDAWGTVPTRVAPLSPVIARAKDKGYPVQYPAQSPIVTDIATFYGPFVYMPGREARYVLPISRALWRLPVALRVENSAATAPIRAEFERILREDLPTKPSAYYLQNDDRAASLLCDAFPTLSPGSDLRQRASELIPRLIENNFSTSAVGSNVEPVTSQVYFSPMQHDFGKESFDREWYIGRQLSTIARCSESVGLDLARRFWPQILGLYRYDRIFFDWVTGSVQSSVFGFNSLADGMHFAWDGMLGVARLARMLGDRETFEDAAYRSARQQTSLFAVWHQAQWSQQLDYGIAHFSVQKLAPNEIETRGAIDGWTEDFGSATLEFRSFWQTANFLYYDNPAQYSFYRDFGLEPRIRTLEYELMPQFHPRWTDGNAFDPVDNRYYGSDHLAAHLLARAVLFHDDPASLFAIYQNIRGTESSKQWYSIFFYGSAGPLLLGLERAKAPIVEIPVMDAQLDEASFDASTGGVVLSMTGRRDKKTFVRVRLSEGEWREFPVNLSADRKTAVKLQPY